MTIRHTSLLVMYVSDSSLLFNLFLNDLEDFFKHNNVSGIESNQRQLDATLMFFLKIFISLYANDTSILSYSFEGLQKALLVYSEFCDI